MKKLLNPSSVPITVGEVTCPPHEIVEVEEEEADPWFDRGFVVQPWDAERKDTQVKVVQHQT
jgi:hypothetical protein